MDCNAVGDTNSDIAGLGIIYAFVVQGGLSVALSIVSVTAEALQVFVRRDTRRFETAVTREKWIICINAVLSSISHNQMVNGMSLLIAALVQHDQLSLYHLHIVYDVVSLTGVSACAALANIIRAADFKVSVGPHTYLLLFSSLYLAYCVVLGDRLSDWDDSVAGQCYDTNRIAAPGARHPLLDNTYLAVTCFYMFMSIYACWECGEICGQSLIDQQQPTRANESSGNTSQPGLLSIVGRALRTEKNRASWLERVQAAARRFRAPVAKFLRWLMFPAPKSGELGRVRFKAALLAVALCQFPVHTYMIFALRTSNEHRLSGDSENVWGFGQIVALVLFGSTLVQSMGAVVELTRHFDYEKRSDVTELHDVREPRGEQAQTPAPQSVRRVNTMPAMPVDLESQGGPVARVRPNSS